MKSRRLHEDLQRLARDQPAPRHALEADHVAAGGAGPGAPIESRLALAALLEAHADTLDRSAVREPGGERHPPAFRIARLDLQLEPVPFAHAARSAHHQVGQLDGVDARRAVALVFEYDAASIDRRLRAPAALPASRWAGHAFEKASCSQK